MDEELRQDAPEPADVPRPAWQVWAARIALAVFFVFLIMYYVNIARGGR